MSLIYTNIFRLIEDNDFMNNISENHGSNEFITQIKLHEKIDDQNKILM